MKIVDKSFSSLLISYDTHDNSDHFCRFGTVKQTRVKRRTIVNENNAAAILAFAALNHMQAAAKWQKGVELVSNLY